MSKRDDLFAESGAEPQTAEGPETKNVKDKAELAAALSADTLFVVFDKDLSVFDGNFEYSVKVKEGFFDEGVLYSEAVEALAEAVSSERKIVTFNLKELMHKFDGLGTAFKADFEDVSVIKYLADFTGRDEKIRRRMRRIRCFGKDARTFAEDYLRQAGAETGRRRARISLPRGGAAARNRALRHGNGGI